MASIADRTTRGEAREGGLIVSPNNLRRQLRLLPGRVERWREMGFDGRYQATMSWDAQMGELEDSAAQYLTGELTEPEQEEYVALLAETYKALPLAGRIGLRGPELPEGHPDPYEALDLS